MTTFCHGTGIKPGFTQKMIIAALLPALLSASFKVAVHDGPYDIAFHPYHTQIISFHADEALAIGILNQHPNFAEKLDLHRSRNPQDLATMDMLVDVGSQYDLASY